MNQHTRPEFPPLRTFTVTRPNYKKIRVVEAFVSTEVAKGLTASQLVQCSISTIPEFIEETVEAHRYYSDNAGTLCFEQHVWDTFAMKVAARMPITMASGTWYDVVEISKHLEVRPAGAVN